MTTQKTCKPWFWKTNYASAKNAGSSKTKAKHSLKILFSIAQLVRATFYYHLKQMNKPDKYELVRHRSQRFITETKDGMVSVESQLSYTTKNHKTVQRFMNKLGLVCRVMIKNTVLTKARWEKLLQIS